MNTIDVMRLCFQLLSNFPSWQHDLRKQVAKGHENQGVTVPGGGMTN
jgi:hypothetical protein